MSSEPQAKPAAGKTVIRNVGLMLSGDIGRPILDADTIVVVDGLIAAVGKESELDTAGATKVIDAQGCVVTPGLIDNHVHTAAGDWTPRQNQIGWIDSTVHGGVTTIISAGEAHYPGRPRDIVGIKALGIAAQRSFANFRPSAMTHTGGPSIPGSGRIGAEVVLEVDADVVAHVNGGPTALPDDEIRRICEEGTRALEIVHNGNLRTGLFVLGIAKERNELDRVILGTDGPAGSGVQPLGILRTICHLASLGDVPTEVVFCFATGNTARVRKLADRGVIEAGRAADLIFMDQAAGGIGKDFLESLALGNLPGIGMIMIDGEVRTARSRNTPPAIRVPEIVAA